MGHSRSRSRLQVYFPKQGIGSVGAIALTRLMSSLLYGVTATDPFTYMAVAILVIMVALAASFLPALRAIRIDPIIALRSE